MGVGIPMAAQQAAPPWRIPQGSGKPAVHRRFSVSDRGCTAAVRMPMGAPPACWRCSRGPQPWRSRTARVGMTAKVVLRTKAAFLLKVVTPFHLGQSITLSSFYPPPHPSKEEERLHRLDPQRALSFFVDRKREFRQDDQLFVGYVGKRKGRAVHKRTLSRWIILCIKLCYSLAKKEPPVGLRVHSTRAKAASSALARGVPVVDIGRAATWASLHTFVKHYCLDSEVRRDGHFARSVLQDFLV
ncbi:hypothetical protein NDU88_006628 [Pleurodeles waltl]|uniref:Tyr recombinase domain-containing protein n=1 Tax=Pleurodeles waltl TaxID=8319 RepID=A0AAV7L663_PLEWA|nr:hypothetical protein NDU88_006628 [Pleurodeles waltl]